LQQFHETVSGRCDDENYECGQDRFLNNQISTCRRLITVFRTKGNTNVDRSSCHRFGFNFNVSVQQAKPFLHAREAQTSTSNCSFDVEAFATISNDEMNFIGRFP
jgi:hypothetical protein